MGLPFSIQERSLLPISRRRAIFGAVVLVVLLFVPSLFSRGPWHVDDLRYAEVAPERTREAFRQFDREAVKR